MTQQTFGIAAEIDDQWNMCYDMVYPPSPTTNTCRQQDTKFGVYASCVRWFSTSLDPSHHYYIANILLRFNTAALPDTAIITGATLRVYVLEVLFNVTDNRSVTADYFTWTGDPDAAGGLDLDATASGTNSYAEVAGTNAHGGTNLSSISSGATKDFALANLSNINRSGNTHIRLHVSGGQPSGVNSFKIAQFGDATNPEAQLLVDYAEGVQHLPPDGIISRTNLPNTTGVTGASDAQALAAIDDDPEAPDTLWLTT